MAIGLFIGRPGSGKSLTLLELYILPALRAGRTVVHNVSGFPAKDTKSPLILKALEEGRIKSFGQLFACDCPLPELAPDGEMKFYPSPFVMPGSYAARNGSPWPRGALVVIDEYYIAASGSLKAQSEREAFFAFLRAHRHYVSDDGFGCDILAAAQHDKDLPIQLREIVEWTTHCRRDPLWKKKLQRLTFGGFCPSSSATAKSTAKGKAVIYKPNPAICALYDSYSGAAPIDEDSGKAVSYLSQFQSSALLLLACLVGLIWLWGYLLLDWFGAGRGASPFAFSGFDTRAAVALPRPPDASCLFLAGSPRGFVLKGSCDYPAGHLLSSPGLADALRWAGDVRAAPVAPAEQERN